MSDYSWLLPAAQGGITLALIALVLRWVDKCRVRHRAGRDPNVMEHPVGMLVLGVVCCGVLLAFVALCLIGPVSPEEDRVICASAFAAMACFCVPIIVQYFRVKHHLEPNGMRYHSVLGRCGFIAWSEVKTVRYSALGRWFRVDAADGDFVRVDGMLMSLPEFANAVLRAVPTNSIEPETAKVLKQTASGSPPSIF